MLLNEGYCTRELRGVTVIPFRHIGETVVALTCYTKKVIWGKGRRKIEV